MAIVGIGVDVVEIERVRSAVSGGRAGARFKQRVFTEQERRYCEARPRSDQSYATRFAAKEAVMKAIGFRSRWGFPWPEIEIVRDGDGAPFVRLHGRTAERAASAGIDRVHVSISHGTDVAVAQAVAERA